MGKINLAIFPNDRKTDEKQPDYYGKISNSPSKDPYPESEVPA